MKKTRSRRLQELAAAMKAGKMSDDEIDTELADILDEEEHDEDTELVGAWEAERRRR